MHSERGDFEFGSTDGACSDGTSWETVRLGAGEAMLFDDNNMHFEANGGAPGRRLIFAVRRLGTRILMRGGVTLEMFQS